jgi:hypothetical protein
MRGVTLLIATTLTFAYGFAAQAAMNADRAKTLRRLGYVTTPAPAVDATRVWYGGTLEPVTVEAPEAPAQQKCALI